MFYAVICNGMRHEFRPEDYTGDDADAQADHAFDAATAFAENNGATVATILDNGAR